MCDYVMHHEAATNVETLYIATNVHKVMTLYRIYVMRNERDVDEIRMKMISDCNMCICLSCEDRPSQPKLLHEH